jgi:hypothetical protein
MTSEPDTGVPTPQQFFAHVIELADLTKQSLLDTQGVREEIRHTLKDFGEANSVTALQIKGIKESYVPQSVEKALTKARAVLASFERENEATSDKSKKQASLIAKAIFLGAVIWTVLITAGHFLAFWSMMRSVPTLTEIADRQSALQTLKEQMDAANQEMEKLKKRLVLRNGQWYVPNTGESLTICLDTSRLETCGPYVRMP